MVGETRSTSAAPWRGHGPDLKGTTPMTMPSPILATAFLVAVAAILTLRATIVAASRKSMIKVRSRQRHPAKTRTHG
jgi:hypothetical protein